MINVQIDENTALNLLMERVEYWTDDKDVINLYEKYYQQCLDYGYFDGSNFDIYQMVDNDIINYTTVIGCDEWGSFNIEDENDEKILISDEKNDLYLIQTY